MAKRLGNARSSLAEVRFRGTSLGPHALGQIRRVIRDVPGQSRHRIGLRICRLFGWRRPNGEWAVRSCTALLVRLDRKGCIRLPPARRRGIAGKGQSGRRRDAMPQGTFERPQNGRTGLLVRPVRFSERAVYQGLMDRFHYLGYRKAPGESLDHVAFLDCVPVALAGWGSATLHNGAREAWIGWDAGSKRRRLHLVATNVRFLMLPPAGAPSGRNLASQVLAASLRRLSADWEACYGHPVLLAETFVDEERFRGTCYRASNWIRIGETNGWSRSGNRYWKHGRRKAVFIYPLDPRARRWLRAASSPVDFWMHKEEPMILDVGKLPLDGEGGLFEVLGTITDPRKPRGVRHKSVGLLAMAVTATLAGARTPAAIAQWAGDLPGEMRMRLGGKRWESPSESTFRRLFQMVDVAEMDAKVGSWAAGLKTVAGTGVVLDGKTLRGSRDGAAPPAHLVSAVLHREGIVLAQTRVADKSNEITSVKPLLAELNVEGAVVTGDAMFAQTGIARHLVEERKADYLFTVKDNQPTLRSSIENMGLESFSPSVRPKEPRPRTH